MNYNHLHYFYMVVRNGSVSAAARFLNISQPALSAQVKSLEGSLGVSLFARRGNKLELTPAGKRVYASSAQMFEIGETISGLATQSKQETMPIQLGIADEIERPFAVSLVKLLFNQWKRSEPPRISFITGHNDHLLGQLRSWSVDAVVTNRPSAFSDLEVADMLVMPVYFAFPSQGTSGRNAIACQNKDVPKMIATIGKGLCAPTARLKLREEADEFLTKWRASPAVAFESDTLATIVRAIVDDVGVGFVPLPYMEREVTKKEIAICGPVEGLWKHTLFLMLKAGRAEAAGVSEIAQAFALLKNEVRAVSQKVQFNGSFDYGYFIKGPR